MLSLLALSAAVAPLALAGNGDGLVVGLVRSALRLEGDKVMCMMSGGAPRPVDELLAAGASADPVHMAPCDDTNPNQMWSFDRVTGGIWSINTGKRMDNTGGSRDINNPIQLWPRRRTDDDKHDGSEFSSSRWTYDPDTQVLALRPMSDLCLDWNFAEGNTRSLRTYRIHEGKNQRWEFVEVSLVDHEAFQIISRDRSQGVKCVAAQARQNGLALKMEPCDGADPLQLWSRNLNSGAVWINEKEGDWQLIDVHMGNPNLGTKIQTWGSVPDPHTSKNGNRNMWWDYCPLTGQIRWRANNDRVFLWNQNTDEIEFGASWEPPSAAIYVGPPRAGLTLQQQFDFVHYDPASLIAPEPLDG